MIPRLYHRGLQEDLWTLRCFKMHQRNGNLVVMPDHLPTLSREAHPSMGFPWLVYVANLFQALNAGDPWCMALDEACTRRSAGSSCSPWDFRPLGASAIRVPTFYIQCARKCECRSNSPNVGSPRKQMKTELCRCQNRLEGWFLLICLIVTSHSKAGHDE